MKRRLQLTPEYLEELRERTIKMNKERGEDITGKVFNGIKVLREVEHTKQGARRWECQCHCGKIFVTTSTTRAKKNKSCGCLNSEIISQKKSTHGMSKTKIFDRYRHILERCYKDYHKSYKDYGGRGIKVCDEWLGENGFMNFYNWAMANGFSEELTIDRIDVDGNYSPQNCRWVSLKEQARNRRNNVLLTYNGETKCVSEWSEILNIKADTLFNRIKRGMPIEKILYPGNLRYANMRGSR